MSEHWAYDQSIEVIIDRRRDRRYEPTSTNGDGASDESTERPRPERRVRVVRVGAPPLPRKARRYASRLTFVRVARRVGSVAERLESERLAGRAKTGDMDAVAELYARYFERVHGYLRLRIRDKRDAEDLTQQVFLRAVSGIASFDPRRAPFDSWLFGIARNALIDHYRAGFKRPELEDARSLEDYRDIAAGPESIEAFAWLEGGSMGTALEQLPISQRQAFLLRELLGFENPEVAAILGCTYDAVRHLQSRARRALRHQLGDLEPVGESKLRTPMLVRIRRARVLRTRRFALVGSAPAPAALLGRPAAFVRRGF